eukprot:TRINITY_DN10558_c0_g1_i1.p1 TRINITY_DN10558_c0_g1~~TRINITY_DN10558_c0_g1_i1.p1  ORF type:complete len:450 (+),score=69.60 TRINITY_DN10558_c0_g1_i1:29-1351(+)
MKRKREETNDPKTEHHKQTKKSIQLLGEIKAESFYGEKFQSETHKGYSEFDIVDHVSFFEEEQVFYTQSALFEYIDDNLLLNLKPFSFEKSQSKSGARVFVACSYLKFSDIYETIPQYYRNFYEIIRKDVPCYLYFDIEFSKLENEFLNGDAILRYFLDFLFVEIYKCFQKETNMSHVIILDSSTDKKFSKHLIVKNLVFNSNENAGQFVTYLMRRIKLQKDDNPKLDTLFVKSGESIVSIIDESVYSKNRNFRIYQSSKIGKASYLTLDPESAYPFTSDDNILLECMICNTHKDISHLVKFEISPYSGLDLTGNHISNPTTHVKKYLNSDPVSRSQSQFKYPLLNRFILIELSKREGSPGSIREWISYKNDTMICAIEGNRYCGNIQREHKSNGIFFVISPQQRVYYQKCHDPDCKSYRSPPTPIPPEFLQEAPEPPTT